MTSARPDVRLVRTISAPRRALFEAWLDPAALRRFMCPEAGSSVGRAEVDARVGGAFLVVMVVGGRELPHSGEYEEIRPYERLAFSWRSPVAGTGSRVTLDFAETETGETRLTLEHFGLSSEQVANHERGWTHILSLLP